LISALRIAQATLQRDGDTLKLASASAALVSQGVESFFQRLGAIPHGLKTGTLFWVAPFNAELIGIGQFDLATGSGRLLQVGRELYHHLPHPFLIADRFPMESHSGMLSDLEWPHTEGLPRRTIEFLDGILKKGHGPLLLGATQAVVDTETIALVATEPNELFVRDLWEMLPESIRRNTSFASYCFAERPEFQLCFVPKLPEPLEGYLDEERVLDYPDSRYERSLQIAIEHGDQREVDRLFARRSTTETVQLMLWILLFLAVVSIAMRFVN
jgi:hypothetical protein